MVPVAGPFGAALTVDVEEWYHTCLVPDYVRPDRRPAGLAEELDWLLPELLDLLAEAGRRATFFVLGEVAERLPGRIREIAAAGHEIASHHHLHLRAGDQTPAVFAAAVGRSKALLEDLTGGAVRGYRAPEWSLRRPTDPRLPLLAAAGHLYDSSLAPFAGAGRLRNPRRPVRLRWTDESGGGTAELLELPPLTFAGPLRLPAGSWTGRLAHPRRIAAAAAAAQARGGLPVLTVHPWELSGRPTPGRLVGLARFIHETGRLAYRRRFRQLLAALPWEPLASAAGLPCTSPAPSG